MKYVTFSFDDGVRQDIRLAKLFSDRGLKCTFNLNSAFLGRVQPHGEWSRGCDVSTVRPDEVREVYSGHEVAMHTVHHPPLATVTPDVLRSEVLDDREALERLSGQKVDGMAYPNGSYDDKVIELLASLGVKYSRTTIPTYSFAPPARWLEWNPTIKFNDDRAPELTEKFLSLPESPEPAIFYIWGHGYECDYADGGYSWDNITRIADSLAGKPGVKYMTNMEIYREITGDKN